MVAIGYDGQVSHSSASPALLIFFSCALCFGAYATSECCHVEQDLSYQRYCPIGMLS